MNTDSTTATAQILDQLNGYHLAHREPVAEVGAWDTLIWDDIIGPADWCDMVATEAYADEHDRWDFSGHTDTVITTAGAVAQFNPATSRWELLA